MDAALVVAALFTSALSGAFGMAGGLLLMGIYASVLPIPEAMALHGATQLVANGGRAVSLAGHVDRRVLGGYAVGAALAAAVAWPLGIVPPEWLVFLALGAVPFAARALPGGAWRDVGRPPTAVACGFTVVGVQLLAGVAGPLLDVFFVDSGLDRRRVVATKAVTQALSHALKLAFFAPLVTDPAALRPGLWVAVGVAALVGTAFGRMLLEGLTEAAFRGAARALVYGIGAVYLSKGVWACL